MCNDLSNLRAIVRFWDRENKFKQNLPETYHWHTEIRSMIDIVGLVRMLFIILLPLYNIYITY